MPHLLNVLHKVVEDNPHVIASVYLLDLHISVNVAVHEELHICSFHLGRERDGRWEDGEEVTSVTEQ